MATVLMGVCCMCQKGHPVIFRDGPRVPVLVVGGWNYRGLDFVMGPHMIGGSLGIRCHDEGEAPQAIYEKEFGQEALCRIERFLEDPTDDTVGYAGEGECQDQISEDEISEEEADDHPDNSDLLAEAVGKEINEAHVMPPEGPDPDKNWMEQAAEFGGRISGLNRSRQQESFLRR